MDATIMELGKKLIALMGDVQYEYDFDPALDPPERLIEIGEHNIREYEKFEAMDEEHKERICNLMSIILATALQKEATEKYGKACPDTIRKVLEDLWKQPDNQAFWGRLRHTEEQCVLSLGLTKEQCQEVMRDIFDRQPEAIKEYIVALCSSSRFLPRSEAQPIATALADMMKEVTP